MLRIGARRAGHGQDGAGFRSHPGPHRDWSRSRFYQDTGCLDGKGINDTEEAAIDAGFISGLNLVSITMPGAEDTSAAWDHPFQGC